jgi:heat shock protein HspQ
MAYTLTKEEKIDIINQHLKNLEYSKYNSEISLVEESAAGKPQQNLIDEIQEQIDNINAKTSALLSTIESLG